GVDEGAARGSAAVVADRAIAGEGEAGHCLVVEGSTAGEEQALGRDAAGLGDCGGAGVVERASYKERLRGGGSGAEREAAVGRGGAGRGTPPPGSGCARGGAWRCGGGWACRPSGSGCW